MVFEYVFLNVKVCVKRNKLFKEKKYFLPAAHCRLPVRVPVMMSAINECESCIV